MRDKKCEVAADVLDKLKLEGLEVLCVGGLAVEAVDPKMQWGTQDTDELDLLIQHKDRQAFMRTMDQGGYKLAEWESKKKPCVPVGSGQVTSHISDMPISPEHGYVPSSCLNKPKEPDLWVNFHTSTRHGRLILVDLAAWFVDKEEAQVMAGTAFARKVHRPPRWAVLLWQAAEVTCMAAEFTTDKRDLDALRHNVDRLRALAADPKLDWSLVRTKAEAYEGEYKNRLRKDAAKKRFDTYQGNLGLGNSDMDIAERQYGALYELSHALRAVKDGGGTVNADVWKVLEPIIAQQPRKLWAYPKVKGHKPIPARGSTGGQLGIAKGDFGIEKQIQYCTSHSNAKFEDLIERQLIPVGEGKPTATPHGPWDKFKQKDMGSIGLP